jgi:hypothetical protein
MFCKTAQEISGKQLLEKQSITTILRATGIIFKVNSVGMNMPNGTERLSEITIDLINQYFKLTTVKNDRTVEHIVSNGKSIFSLDSRKEFTEEEVKTLVLCTSSIHQNYYTYLYGLPMKLKDPGTIISSVVNRKNFLGISRFKSQIRGEHRDRFLVFLF